MEYPIEVLEVYDTIEKLLSPKNRIVKENSAMSKCILIMLNDLYERKNIQAVVAISDIEKEQQNKTII